MNVSFGSTYTITATSHDKSSQLNGYLKMTDYCEKNNVNYVHEEGFIRNSSREVPRFWQSISVTVPDEQNATIEDFCNMHNIKFNKIDTENILEPEAILSRIKEPPENSNMQKIHINAEKLEKLLENHENNFEHCKSDYKKYFHNKTDYMLKSGKPINAPCLNITPESGLEDTIDYINKYNSANLNDNMLFIDLFQKTTSPEHCLYFALRDLGMNKIPVYVNEDTAQLCQALELTDFTGEEA